MKAPRIGRIRLSEKMDKLVNEISSEMNVNQQMVIPVLLVTLASIVQSKFEIFFIRSNGSEYHIPLALFTILVAESGSGKSPVFKRIVTPLDELINEINVLREEKNREIEIENELIDSEIKAVMKESTKSKFDRNEVKERIKKLENEKRAIYPPADIYKTDCTASGLASNLAEQEGHRISIMDQEGSSALLLKYDSRLVSHLNRGFDNEFFSPMRAKGNANIPTKGIVSVLMCMQPAKFEELIGKNNIWDEGFLPRALPFFGISFGEFFRNLLGGKRSNTDEGNYIYFKERLKFLLNYPWEMSDNGCMTPHLIRMTDAAIDLFEKKVRYYSININEDDELIKAWRSKAPTTMLRIAAIFHIYETEGDPLTTPIQPELIEIAGELMQQLVPNVDKVREMVAPTPNEIVTDKVVRWLLNHIGLKEVSQRELMRAINCSKECILPTIIKFLDEGVLEGVRAAHSSPGRPASPRYIVNWVRLKECYLLE